MARKKHHSRWFIIKEFTFGGLALVSIGLVLIDLFSNLSISAQHNVNHVDFVIACLFLADFILGVSFSKNRKHYLVRNWYYALAAIPFTDTATEALRGLRVLRLIRLVRAGEHLDYGLVEKKS